MYFLRRQLKKLKSRTGVGLSLTVFLVIFAYVILPNYIDFKIDLSKPIDFGDLSSILQEEVIPENEPPVPDEMRLPPVNVPIEITAADCRVKVTYFSDAGKVVGGGILVTYDGVTFVLTSSMLSTTKGEGFIIEGHDEIQRPAYLIATSDELGLTALRVYDDVLPTVELIEEPKLKLGVETTVYGTQGIYQLTVSNYLRKHKNWMVLEGSVPRDISGAPIIQDGRVIGTVVGLNATNQTQVIATSNKGLVFFANEIAKSGDK